MNFDFEYVGPFREDNRPLRKAEPEAKHSLDQRASRVRLVRGGLSKNERPMLPPFIIEQIRKREEEARRSRQQDQPRLDIPLDIHRPALPEDDEAESPDRGIVIVDLLGDS